MSSIRSLLERSLALFQSRLVAVLQATWIPAVAGGAVSIGLFGLAQYFVDLAPLALSLAGLSVIAMFATVCLAYQCTIRVLANPSLAAVPALVLAVPRLLPFSIACLAFALSVAAGIALFIVPGILFWLWFGLTPYTAAVEGKAPMDALRQSRDYVRPRSKAVFKRLAVMWLFSVGVLVVPVVGWAITLAMTPLKICYEYLLYEEVRGGVPVDHPGGTPTAGLGAVGVIVLIFSLLGAGISYSVGTPEDFIAPFIRAVTAEKEENAETFPPPPPIIAQSRLPEPGVNEQRPLIPNAAPAPKPVQVNPRNAAGWKPLIRKKGGAAAGPGRKNDGEWKTLPAKKPAKSSAKKRRARRIDR